MAARKLVKKIKLPLVPVSASLDLQAQSVQVAFPIVGIGASAGGLAAFEAFFSGMPADRYPDMAFVLVQHLAPDHKSILTELIQRYTSMQVFEVEDGMQVNINCAYIIPPNYDMAFLNGRLHLLDPSAPRGQRLPIDFLFRSLAQDQHERAIGIVLSGTGSDGTQGIRAIKNEGGMILVQKPESTEFDGMPRSAIATGLVDCELLPEQMPAKLIAYASHTIAKPENLITTFAKENENALQKIFILLRVQTGHDFSQYKPNTINRRIERRMAVHQIESIDHYVKYLQQTSGEVVSLFRDLLIGVTNFFRDPEAFQSLEKLVIPKLFEGKPTGSVIRVWSIGCSTGEEAYSLAILLQEYMESYKLEYTVQVFATDIDSRAIATARTGIYPASVVADITPERLARFFKLQADGSSYRVESGLRAMLIFSEQDLIKDPPFSKIDLISCRNLLIYISAELQKTIIPLFHFALKPNGMLFLGTSEGIGDYAALFSVLDQKAKLYQRKEGYQAVPYKVLNRLPPPLRAADVLGAQGAGNLAALLAPAKLSLKELTEQTLLRLVAPPCALINSQGDILYLHGKTSQFLELASGEVGINNILKMAREGLRHDLISALEKSIKIKDTVRCTGLHVKTHGYYITFNLTVCPVMVGTAAAPESYLYLVVLEALPPAAAGHLQQIHVSTGSGVKLTDAEVCIEALKQELRIKDEYLQSTYEKLETSNEELKSSNEEMQSINEELQSTNEELETSKEELQSVNEELATVNGELQTKVTDLSRANNDMNNLLAGTGVGTVFVDHQLCILRFTPAVSAIINLIQSDIGRPINHISPNFVGYGAMVQDTQAVLNTLAIKEVEVQISDGKWYTMRIQPYRTLDNVIEGAVISFFNISETVLAREALRKANDLMRLSVVVRDAHDAITMQDMTGHILAWNPGAVRMYGWSETEALNMNVLEMMPQPLRKDALETLRHLSQTQILQPYHTQRISKHGDVLEVSIISSALLNEAGETYAISTTERIRGGAAS